MINACQTLDCSFMPTSLLKAIKELYFREYYISCFPDCFITTNLQVLRHDKSGASFNGIHILVILRPRHRINIYDFLVLDVFTYYVIHRD